MLNLLCARGSTTEWVVYSRIVTGVKKRERDGSPDFQHMDIITMLPNPYSVVWVLVIILKILIKWELELIGAVLVILRELMKSRDILKFFGLILNLIVNYVRCFCN